MYDTIACYTNPPRILPDDLFEGGMVTEMFNDARVSARLWRNPKPDESYSPRVTYWRPVGKRDTEQRVLRAAVDEQDIPEGYEVGVLKLEFSIPKMLNDVAVLLSNVSGAQVDQALDRVDNFVHQLFDLPSVRDWKCGRVDYAWMWPVGPLLPAYMSVLNKLRLSTFHRHPFDATEGVVWKSKSRWVKFYNKTLELGIKTSDMVLRFEVSNYRDAVRRMCRDWFKCEQVVSEVVRPGRALYVMAYAWEKLGLGVSDSYGYDEYELLRLRDYFGDRVSTAYYVLHMMRDYGADAYKEPLNVVSKSMYYSYRRELMSAGFITVVDEDVRVVRQALPALHLPTENVYSELKLTAQNLADFAPPDDIYTLENFWQILAVKLGLMNVTPSKYLFDRWTQYVA